MMYLSRIADALERIASALECSKSQTTCDVNGGVVKTPNMPKRRSDSANHRADHYVVLDTKTGETHTYKRRDDACHSIGVTTGGSFSKSIKQRKLIRKRYIITAVFNNN